MLVLQLVTIDKCRQLKYFSQTTCSIRTQSCAYFMSVHSDRHSKRSCQTKVSEFNAPCSIQQKILWFEVAMQDTMAVAEENSL